MARYSGAHPIVDQVPVLPRSIRVSGATQSDGSVKVTNARPDLPPPKAPANGVPLVAWEGAPSTPSPPVAVVGEDISPRASDDVWGAPQVRDPISVLPLEFMEPIDPPTDLPGIEGFLEALED